MANITKWSNVAVAVQSTLGAALTITGITKANPGVVTSTAHGLANGDYVTISAQGMYQLDGRVFRVSGVAANTFNLEGEDTTNYDTFTSGSAYKITYGTSMTTATGLTASGGDFDFKDTTTIHTNVKTQIPGAANPATYTFESIWDAADAGLVALKAASDNQAQRAIRFTFANGQKVVFNGYVGYAGLPIGNAQDIVKTSVVITMYGRPTIYAT